MILHFENKMNGKSLLLDSAQYINSFNQTFTVSKLRYYISNISFGNDEDKWSTFPQSFLIDAADSASQFIHLSHSAKEKFTSIKFIVGVDSLHNCSGAQTGNLDPLKGMFWTWNTGYIFFKIEGHAATSPQPGNIFEYHIGGYMKPHNNIKTIELALPDIDQTTNTIQYTITAAIDSVLNGQNKIDFSIHSSITTLPDAWMIAGDYGNMFSIEK